MPVVDYRSLCAAMKMVVAGVVVGNQLYLHVYNGGMHLLWMIKVIHEPIRIQSGWVSQ